MIDNHISEIVKQYIALIIKRGISVKEVYVFGSFAKGTMNTGSDIDVCIISDQFGKDRQQERVSLMNIREGISDLIEPHPYSTSDFNDPYDALSCEIKKTGVRIQ